MVQGAECMQVSGNASGVAGCRFARGINGSFSCTWRDLSHLVDEEVAAYPFLALRYCDWLRLMVGVVLRTKEWFRLTVTVKRPKGVRSAGNLARRVGRILEEQA